MNGRRETVEGAAVGFMQVRVPIGPARAVFVYRPRSWTVGTAVTLLALAALALGALRLYRREDFVG